MTNSVNYQNQSIPAYSGITINISNPTLNAAPLNQNCPPNCQQHNHQPGFSVEQQNISNNQMQNPVLYNTALPKDLNSQRNPYLQTETVDLNNNLNNLDSNVGKTANNVSSPQEAMGPSYPPQEYLNNYNYIQGGENKGQKTNSELPENGLRVNENNIPQYNNSPFVQNQAQAVEEDLSTSKEIISDLDSRVNEQKELEKNGSQTKVVALTNEYIMSLENYLNNPNTEIRLMASKEVLTRLDEDKDRFDDAALNALLNKMLQDPEKLVRIAALSAFASQLASGNDYTVSLLTDIQNNPNSDKEDALQAADSLLKMSTRTEIRYKPVQNNYVVEQTAE